MSLDAHNDTGDEELSAIGSVNFTEDDGVITPLFVFEGSAGTTSEKEHDEPETEESVSKADDPLDDTVSLRNASSSTTKSNEVKFADGGIAVGEEVQVKSSPKLRRRRDGEDLPLPPNLVRTNSARPVLATEWRTSAYLSLDHRLPGPEAAKPRAREGLELFFSLHLSVLASRYFFFFFFFFSFSLKS